MSEQLSLPDLPEPPPAPSPRERRIASLRQRRAAAKARFDRAVVLCNTQAQRTTWRELFEATNAALRGRA